MNQELVTISMSGICIAMAYNTLYSPYNKQALQPEEMDSKFRNWCLWSGLSSAFHTRFTEYCSTDHTSP